ncbi:UDP-3-O-acyl-N-acetylglucosamine deacetylase [Geomonas paludis]|uniref:UDP-3-O-acyl-N-acetylglucosamine deacetylase n=1 Tax=Geomonas paludis TaxID=2740185 RepID=A0A6V8N0L8_9BACT|nr:UDP-3-O-acyl-N-acetylglucosamine deacetylase [Geomonas paludis]UPU36923.1 UDP-3-O-acyl-N-acetylglucosamine deacetylase [Geomonas paludis]GFO65594.1 UDP-3-O-acyl-N-acetylglucosamine deacetylase [Geomonas paludis]
MIFQQTLGNKVTFSGIGLHTGKTITITLRPAEPGTGVVFHRVDLTPAVSIEAHAQNVVNTRLSTTIGRGEASVSTIEHLMAALYGCGIDNAHVDINGPEVPIMDGSAAPFVAAIVKAGTKESKKPRKYLVIKKPVSVTDGDKKASIIPSRHYKISFDMQFAHPAVMKQHRSLEFSQTSFTDQFAAARTFCFLAEVEMMKAHGLALGGSLDNAVVIGDHGVLNPEGLRFQDEFVRHKILDSVGDLSLAGHRLIGHVKATKSGHDLNHKLVMELLKRPDCYTLIEFTPQAFNAPFNLSLPELAWLEA